MTGGPAHWDEVYSRKRPDQVSWFQPVPEQSLRWIEEAGVPAASAIIDVGGGASTLVDELLSRGFRDVTVLDISEQVLHQLSERLSRHEFVHFVAEDVTAFQPTRRYALWHDRAVFHFLTEAAQRHRYRDTLTRATGPGSHVLIATFGPEGPTRCSGLETARYDAEQLAAELGPGFRLVKSAINLHHTPAGARQQFLYTHFMRI